jgi:archaemetzincin
MLSALLPVALALVMSVTGSLGPVRRPVVAIQPLGRVDASVVDDVRAGIVGRFDVDVVVLPVRALPASAYYPARDRYRADRLLETLDGEPAAAYAKVVALTEVDVSTTKDDVADWGVFGLGDIDGPSCVISTFRLGRGDATPALRESRLVKAVNHELGHTFGMAHCDDPACLMADAEGSIASVDSRDDRFCAACLARLGALARAPSGADAGFARAGR